MPEWPNSRNLTIQDGGCRHLQFRNNVNNSGLDKDICTKFYGKTHHGHAEVTTLPKVARKLISVTSSNDHLKHMCVDLSDYNTYLNQILYRAQILHYQYAGMVKFT